MLTKSQPQYVDVDASFRPLPKYGHLSEKTAEYAAAEADIKERFAPLYAAPDWPSMRQLSANIDAVIPPGGPDRYRDVTTELLHFPARDGHMIELKVYKSPLVEKDATLMYRMHGGGWAIGDHEIDGAENVHAAALHRNIVVISVDYRRAPEHPFPQPLQDCYDGLLWCKKNAADLGVNAERIIVAGGSAGGNLAAALAIEAREHGVTGIVAQVLHFPSLCHPKFFPKDKYEYGSFVQNSDNPVLNLSIMEAFLDAHVPNAKPDHRHSPLLASSLRGLPPALIQCSGVDPLRDEAFAYAEALKSAGVEVEIHAYKGLPHCFHGVLLEAPETVDFFKVYHAFLNRYL